MATLRSAVTMSKSHSLKIITRIFELSVVCAGVLLERSCCLVLWFVIFWAFYFVCLLFVLFPFYKNIYIVAIRLTAAVLLVMLI